MVVLEFINLKGRNVINLVNLFMDIMKRSYFIFNKKKQVVECAL